MHGILFGRGLKFGFWGFRILEFGYLRKEGCGCRVNVRSCAQAWREILNMKPHTQEAKQEEQTSDKRRIIVIHVLTITYQHS